jgi:hypothetical protein
MSKADNYRAQAIDEYESDDVVFRDNAGVEIVEGGAWVEAWVWADEDDIGGYEPNEEARNGY